MSRLPRVSLGRQLFGREVVFGDRRILWREVAAGIRGGVGRTDSGHTQQRIRQPFIIKSGSLGDHETPAAAERDRVDVVLVDVYAGNAVIVHDAAKKYATHTGSLVSGVNEQHLKFVSVCASKADGQAVEFCHHYP